MRNLCTFFSKLKIVHSKFSHTQNIRIPTINEEVYSYFKIYGIEVIFTVYVVYFCYSNFLKKFTDKNLSDINY